MSTVNQISPQNLQTHLPLIPISPLIQQSLLYSHSYANASTKLTQAKQANPPTPTAALRRLIEDVTIQKKGLDTANVQLQSVADYTLLHWDPDAIARQITIVDAHLFAQVSLNLNKTLLTREDRRASKLQALLDFHRYLTNSFTHQLIIYPELSRIAAASSSSNSNSNPRDSIITHVIRVAYLLLHVYRDFSGFAAVMRALSSPEVRRVRRLWASVTSRNRDVYKDLVRVISANNDHKIYKDILSQKLEIFGRDVGQGVMVAVPWIQPHWHDVRAITLQYSASHHFTPASDAISNGFGIGASNPDLVLSTPGAVKLALVLAILSKCQANAVPADDEEEAPLYLSKKPSSKSASSAHKPITLEGLRNSFSPPSDISNLSQGGDPLLYHWLVSRVYLTKQQLLDESTEIEPLMHGEELPCNQLSEDDGLETDDIGLTEEEERRRMIDGDDDDEVMSVSQNLRTNRSFVLRENSNGSVSNLADSQHSLGSPVTTRPSSPMQHKSPLSRDVTADEDEDVVKVKAGAIKQNGTATPRAATPRAATPTVDNIKAEIYMESLNEPLVPPADPSLGRGPRGDTGDYDDGSGDLGVVEKLKPLDKGKAKEEVDVLSPVTAAINTTADDTATAAVAVIAAVAAEAAAAASSQPEAALEVKPALEPTPESEPAPIAPASQSLHPLVTMPSTQGIFASPPETPRPATVSKSPLSPQPKIVEDLVDEESEAGRATPTMEAAPAVAATAATTTVTATLVQESEPAPVVTPTPVPAPAAPVQPQASKSISENLLKPHEAASAATSLSPAAPEFVPKFNVTTLALSPTAPTFVPSLTSILAQGSQPPPMEFVIDEEEDEDEEDEEEEDGEEWKGYNKGASADAGAGKNSFSVETMHMEEENSEEEEWTGYKPDPSLAATATATAQKQDDDDETWKGYPHPHDTAEDDEGPPHPHDTAEDDEGPLHPHDTAEDDEEWKGYGATAATVAATNLPNASLTPNTNPDPTPTMSSRRRTSSLRPTTFVNVNGNNVRSRPGSVHSDEWRGYTAQSTEQEWQDETAKQAHIYDWKGYTLEKSEDDELETSSIVINGEIGRDSPNLSAVQPTFEEMGPYTYVQSYDANAAAAEYDDSGEPGQMAIHAMAHAQNGKRGRGKKGNVGMQTISRAASKNFMRPSVLGADLVERT
ncbi:RasGEF domain-containing protein [Endogone sp. FLAS-F59071]|nr:RasGEF domain-containing protein [Endogone sp. FLAS-F59071]|eukprot:RUS14328.1 RasGEF domain-containing protein [Endogone sp. FLAS-F59071]